MKKAGPLARAVLFSILISSFSSFLSADSGPSLKKVSFLPLWVPQAQFAGYYVAYEKGFYRDRGLDVLLMTGGPDLPPAEQLEQGKVDFAMLWLAAGIEKKAGGVPLVNIAQMVQRSALMLVAKKSSGIRTAADMNGKKVGLWDAIFRIQPRAFFRKYNLDVRVVPQSFSVNLFLRDGVDVASAMWYNEYHTLLNSGLNSDEITTFFFYDHGLNFPEDGIYVLEETCRNDPETCRAFVAASIAGWTYAFDHPEEALDIVMEYMQKAHVPATRVHQRWMLERMKDLMIQPGSGEVTGMLLAKDYATVANSLLESGFIKAVPEFGSFYRRCAGDEKK